MATSSPAPRPLLSDVGAFVERLEAAAGDEAVPLLVFRVPEFAHEAWQRGKRAAHRLERKIAAIFAAACARTLRAHDAIAHDAGSDVFLAAMLAPARGVQGRSAVDCRAVLERIALAMSIGAELRIERGWSQLREVRGRESLGAEVERALERGERERERYEFFAAVGHELRTPLTSIRGYLETLIEENVDRETSRRFLETARREALRMGRLIDGMFEFSLLDLSAASLPGRQSDLRACIQAACETVDPLAASRSVSIELGSCAGAPVMLEADALIQMLVNILDNAVKYGNAGGRICINAFGFGDEVRILVDDDGPGIAASENESIFGLRVRGERQSAWPGTGIGLAIVKMIADRAGGRVRCGTSPLGGARFELVLPARAESESAVS